MATVENRIIGARIQRPAPLAGIGADLLQQ